MFLRQANSGNQFCGPFHSTFILYRAVTNRQRTELLLVIIEQRHYLFSSSRGRSNDGRIKPEKSMDWEMLFCQVLAQRNTGYDFAWGTSMASPAVAGGLALFSSTIQTAEWKHKIPGMV